MRPMGFAAATAVALICSTAGAFAQDYPNRTVTIVAPAAPGGLYSLFARLVGAKPSSASAMRSSWRTGRARARWSAPCRSLRSAPDGTRSWSRRSSTMATNLTLFKSLPYDPRIDLDTDCADRPACRNCWWSMPPCRCSRSPISPSSPTRRPAACISARQALAPPQHLGGEMLKAALWVQLTHVPYKGMQPAISDVALRPYRDDLQPDPDRAAADPGRQGAADRRCPWRSGSRRCPTCRRSARSA